MCVVFYFCCFQYYSFHLIHQMVKGMQVLGCFFYCVTCIEGNNDIFQLGTVCVFLWFYANYNFRLVSFSFSHKFFLATSALSILFRRVYFQ